MVQFASVRNRSRRWLVWITSSNIQLEGCTHGQGCTWCRGKSLSSQGWERHRERRGLGHQSRARCAPPTLPLHLISTFDAGISSFADNLDGIPAYLAPLLDHARTHIPPSLHSETPLFLLATAGMRLLSPEQQAAVLQTTCNFLRFHSDFRIDSPSSVGPCGSSVRIITGEEEGLFGWIAVNYLMDGFGPSNSDRSTYGFLDMGGASTQIAFEPSPEEQEKAQNLVEVRLRLIGGEEITHKVFVTTWLGYGTNQARERYVGQAIRQHDLSSPPLFDESPPITDVIDDPCLPKDLTLIESPVFPELSGAFEQKSRTLHGTGSFEQLSCRNVTTAQQVCTMSRRTMSIQRCLCPTH
jgi:Golgi apyrase